MAKTEEEKVEQPSAKNRATEDKDRAPKRSAPWPLITIGIFATIVIGAVIIGSWLLMGSLYSTRIAPGARDNNSSQRENRDGSYGWRNDGDGRFEGFGVVRGVIVKVEGDTLTVAGNGRQTTVKTNDETRINGTDTEVAVNDSVVIVGTTESDGSVTAQHILINNDISSQRKARPSI